MPRALIIDTETNGVVEPMEAIELAWMEMGAEQSNLWTPGNSHVERFKPTQPLSYGALAVHHILPEELEACPPAADAKLPFTPDYIIGHNVDFDWKVLGKPPCKRICTLALSRATYESCDSHTQSAMYYFLNGANSNTRTALKEAHSAAADIMFCFNILTHLIAKLHPRNIEQLWELSEEARIPRLMPFGKHKGLPIRDIDAGYKAWYRKQADADPYILMAMSRGGR